MDDSLSNDSAVEWKVVAETNNPPEAHVIAGLLQTQGLRVWVQQESYGSTVGITVGMLGEVRVLVPAEEYQQAMEILEADPNPAEPAENIADEGLEDDQ